MATKSFLKTIDIHDKHLADSFVTAIQKAETTESKPVEYKSTPKEIKGAAAVKEFLERTK